MGKLKKALPAKFWLVVVVFVIVFLPPFAKYQALCYKNRKLEAEIEAMKLKNEQLAEEKRLLETDIHYVEKKAREKVGLVRKGEIVMKEVQVRK
ncbi:MAG: septum formation initiator family protein [Candidatus Omnitrophica bacterium]|nr:septum formation initiator family protein [Candidatus Omnitrophota bacterium]